MRAGFYQNVDKETDFLVIEEWAIPKDSDDHMQFDIFAALLGDGILMHRPPEIVVHTVSGSTELEDWGP
jgi:hypothetical protein